MFFPSPSTMLHGKIKFSSANVERSWLRRPNARCNPADFLEDNLYDAHVGKSAYALQLVRWFAVFGRDKFKVSVGEGGAREQHYAE